MGSVTTVSASIDWTSPGGERTPRHPGQTRRHVIVPEKSSSAFAGDGPRVRMTSLARTRMKDRSR